jgi:hypothetical protein
MAFETLHAAIFCSGPPLHVDIAASVLLCPF